MARPGLMNHRKFRRLVRLLREPPPHVRGYLELLWDAAYENGDPLVGDETDVASVCQFPGETAVIANALVDAGGEGEIGFLERDDAGRYLIHDLFDHAPEYVRRRMEREFERQSRGETISDLRRKAANAMHEKRRAEQVPANDVQTSANDRHLDANGDQLYANDSTPAPAPAPALALAPAQKDSTGRARKNGAPPATGPTWDAYRSAYQTTYHVEPVRNARVNSQLVQLIGRIGLQDAPDLAAWFLGHRGSWYVQQGHTIGSLLRDCEKLHTEWLNGNRLHKRDADEIDRTSADVAMWKRIEARTEAKRKGNTDEAR